MVNRIALTGFLMLGAGLLAGCPDDLGEALKNGTNQGLMSPAALSATTNDACQILLSWEDRATMETGYRLEISPGPFGTSGSAGMTFVTFAAGVTTYAYAGVPKTTYYLRLFAVTDTMESDPSNEIVVTTPDLPTKPQILDVTGDWSIIIVRWGPVTGEAALQFEVSEDGGPWKLLPQLIPADFDRAAFVPTPGVHHYAIRLHAIGSFGNRSVSDPVGIYI